MPPRAADADAVIAAVRALAASRPQETIFVGIDGYGAAGKTTLASQVDAAVPRAVVVHVDDFSAPAFSTWGWERFRDQVAEPLLAGRSARYQRWDWAADRGAEWHDVAPGHVVIVEGVASTRDELALPWALRVWVEAPRDLRLTRARDRDGEAMLPRWLDDWMPSEEAYAAAQRPRARADLVVSGADEPG